MRTTLLSFVAAFVLLSCTNDPQLTYLEESGISGGWYITDRATDLSMLPTTLTPPESMLLSEHPGANEQAGNWHHQSTQSQTSGTFILDAENRILDFYDDDSTFVFSAYYTKTDDTILTITYEEQNLNVEETWSR